MQIRIYLLDFIFYFRKVFLKVYLIIKKEITILQIERRRFITEKNLKKRKKTKMYMIHAKSLKIKCNNRVKVAIPL
jgi:hypothetical protein